MTEVVLRRYTSLSSTLHVLQHRCLTLLSPNKWDDRNDAYFLDQYRRKKNAVSVLALCFAEAPETYHHWRVFANGPEGVCINFRKEKLEAFLEGSGNLIYKKVQYKKLHPASPIKEADLPFVKRWPYRDEKEYRIIHASDDEIESFPVEVSLAAIDRITLSPWMPIALSNAVKSAIRNLRGCSRLNVYRSTLVETETWKKRANPQARRVI